nr:unnamed protein product [Callosobruchus analis]
MFLEWNLNFEELYEGPASPFVLKKKTDLGEDFLISRVVHLQVRRDKFDILLYKESFDKNFKEIALNRRSTRNVNVPNVQTRSEEASETRNEMSVIGSLTLYRKIFDSMNLSFHHPKKDQSSLCMRVHQIAGNEIDEGLKREFDIYSSNKSGVREIKQDLRAQGFTDSKPICAVFDLQQVIQLPISNESTIFYKQHLNSADDSYHKKVKEFKAL